MDETDQPNPFQSPTSDASSYSTGVDPSARTVDALRATRPWVMFLAILGAIVSVLTIGMIALQTLAIGFAGAGGGPPGKLAGLWIGAILVWGLVLFLQLMPVIYLFRYASRIKDFVASGAVGDLDSALEAQKSFWRFIGIVAAVVVVMYALIFLLAIVGFGGGWVAAAR